MPTYDNAWLRARESAPSAGWRQTDPQTLERDIMHSPEEQARRIALSGDEGRQDQILNDARNYLSGAPDYSSLASVPDRLAGIQAEQAAGRPSLRGLTEPLATAGRFSTTASLPAAFVPGMQGLAAVLGAGGTALQLPDMLRRGYAPEEDEEAPGAMEAGFAGLGLIPGMSAARGTARGLRRGISDINRPLGPSRYESAIGAMDSPNFQRANSPRVASSVPNPHFSASGRALSEVSTPGAQRYMNEQFAQNKETAFQTLGKQVDPDRALREAVENLYAGPAEEVLSPLDRLSRIRERGAFARSRPQDVR